MEATEISPETSGPDIYEPLIPAAEYAVKYGITRRTVDRYARSGKVERLRQGGRTLIVDKAPVKPETQSDSSGTAPVDLIVAPVRNDWIAFGAASAFAESRHHWQTAFFVAVSLLIIILIVGSGAGVWFWQGGIGLQSSITDSQNQVSSLQGQLQRATQSIGESQTEHIETVGGLQKRIDTFTVQIDDLTKSSVQLTEANTELTLQIIKLSGPYLFWTQKP